VAKIWLLCITREEKRRNVRISELWLLLSKRDFYLVNLRIFVTEQVSTF